MATTNFMNLDLPTPTVTLGPQYATDNNTAFTLVDEHDHTSGKGVAVPSSGLNINANLSFGGFKPFELLATQFNSQGATLVGAGNINSVYVTGGNLYFTNGSGNAVQLTDGGSLVSTPATFSTLEITSINSNLTISAGATFVFIATDTSGGAIQIDLPLAANVANGRVYAIKDSAGDANANPITVARQGSDFIDGGTSFEMDSNYGCTWFIGDGVSNWYRL